MAPRRIHLFGSAGSIGRRALDVVRDHPEIFVVTALSTGSNSALLEAQIEEFHPAAACLADERLRREAEGIASRQGIPVFCGPGGMERLAREFEADLAIVATVGFSGLIPCLTAIDSGMDIALANKEALVVGGEIVMREARRKGARILPIDSEHNAISQCLMGQDRSALQRIILTASGGPFRGGDRDRLAQATVKEALAHPTWNMGPKITIDSATLMNKGFEAIEAHHLFELPMSRIEVVVHPQSVIHSMVEFVDRSILAHLGPTDMYLPIQNVMMHPQRAPNSFRPLDLTKIGPLTFEAPDLERFPCLGYAYEAARAGGLAPAVLNAANEVAVQRFLEGEIRFLDIPALIRDALDEHQNQPSPSLEEIVAADRWARERAFQHVA